MKIKRMVSSRKEGRILTEKGHMEGFWGAGTVVFLVLCDSSTIAYLIANHRCLMHFFSNCIFYFLIKKAYKKNKKPKLAFNHLVDSGK